MQKSMRIVLAVAVLGVLAACAKKAEEETVSVDNPVYVDNPVTVEPTYTGKYK